MDIIDKFCKYFQENRKEEFLSLFNVNATYTDCLYGSFHGIEQIARFFERCHREANDYKFIPKNKIFQNNLYSFEWNFSFISNMPLSSGKTIKIEGCSFLKTEKHKIIYYRDYTDSILFLLEGNIPEKDIIKFYKKKFSKGC